jgi:1-deoxy-D-xylulose-5-phosphate reductoisomerase
MKKKLAILGSTGSIGRATLEVVDNQRGTFEVFCLACKENTELLNEQIDKFKPKYVCVYEESLKGRVRFDRKRLLTGIKGINEIVGMDEDIVINAMPGSIGLEPTICALKSKKVVALANKESLVMAGRIVSKLLKTCGSKLIPVDSEHSALFQVMKKVRRQELKTITITASGGPFRNHTKTSLVNVKPEEALNHPTWKMGNKVTLDSATLMNKGLEVIEARWLFNIQPELIRVLVHPESIIHGMIECTDGAFIAYMANPDMKIPISFAINEGNIRSLPSVRLNLEDLHKLTFYKPDTNRFPSLRLAFDALRSGDSALVALNASNEVVSDAFINGRIRFTDIPVFIEEVLEHQPVLPTIEDIETIWEIHDWAKRYTEEIIKGSRGKGQGAK